MHNAWIQTSDRRSWVRVDQVIGVYTTDVSGVTNKARVMLYLQNSDPDATYIYRELDTQEEAERVAIELVEFLASIPEIMTQHQPKQYRKRYNSAVEHHINPRTGSVVIHTPKDPRTGTFRQREVHPDTESLDDKVVEPELDVRQETES